MTKYKTPSDLPENITEVLNPQQIDTIIASCEKHPATERVIDALSSVSDPESVEKICIQNIIIPYNGALMLSKDAEPAYWKVHYVADSRIGPYVKTVGLSKHATEIICCTLGDDPEKVKTIVNNLAYILSPKHPQRMPDHLHTLTLSDGSVVKGRHDISNRLMIAAMTHFFKDNSEVTISNRNDTVTVLSLSDANNNLPGEPGYDNSNGKYPLGV